MNRKSFHNLHPTTFTIPELAASDPIIMDAMEKEYLQMFNDEMRSPAITEGQLSYGGSNKTCSFLVDVADDCSRSRFWGKALQFYLLEQNPDDFKDCRCLMVNCQEHFTSVKEMLWHLKRCECFSEGMFRCPDCSDTKKFPTTSSKKCLYRRERLSQKLQRKLKAMIKTLTNHRSGSKILSENCKECGQSLGHEPLYPPVPEGHQHFSPYYDPFEIQVPKELPDKQTLRQELQAETSLGDEKMQLSKSYNDIFCSVSDQSPSDQSPSELSALSPSEEAIMRSSTGVSPTSFTQSSTTTASTYSQIQDSSADQYQHAEAIQAVPDTQIISNNGNYIEQGHDSFHRPYLSRPYSIPSSYYSISQAACNHSSLPIGRGQSLSIQTGNLQPTLDNSVWSNFFDGNTINPKDIGESPIMGEMSPSSLSSRRMSALPNFEAYTDFNDLSCGMQEPVMDTIMPSSSSSQPPNSELSEHGLHCPHMGCDYITRGKPENFKSYLRKHLLTHDGTQSFKCEHCGKDFTRPDNKEVHSRKAHPARCLLTESKKRRGSWDNCGNGYPRNKRASISEDGSR
ncbi:hypothetical protein M426DRAFT_12060 [Hypoxylon sp. CI-4A]|nr:hypothetical protein M426DRAFT_12060 [Hypoxylon sp. CI-4A]